MTEMCFTVRVGAYEWATLMHNGGDYALSQGRYQLAEQMLHKARNTLDGLLGAEHPLTTHIVFLVMFASLEERLEWCNAVRGTLCRAIYIG